MKLYAKLSSERNGKEVGKGGDKYLEIALYVGPEKIGTVILDEQGGKDWNLSYEKYGQESYLIDKNEQSCDECGRARGHDAICSLGNGEEGGVEIGKKQKGEISANEMEHNFTRHEHNPVEDEFLINDEGVE